MTVSDSVVPKQCMHCGSSRIAFKSEAGSWECQDCGERFAGPPPEANPKLKSGRAARPKKIFFSYGHDDNRELVQLFQEDLDKRGHKVWIDFEKIGTWDDWKGRITRGIDDSQLTIAFLSKHAIRDPGVCRNEIAIALNRFGTVYPILLESGIEGDIPVTIRNLQWPDLSRWRDIRDGKVPGVDWERWYEEKLLNLVEKLEGEATTFADETSVLRKTLNPSSFESKFVQHIPGFIGREWVFDAYRQWLDKDSRLFWIKASPGVGKSAISANLAHRERSAIVACWFCDAKSPELKNPANALRSIAFQLALRWEDYRVRLLRQLQLTANTSEESCDEARKELEKKDTHDLFRLLLAEPLANLIWREHKLVIVIDALDEGSGADGSNLITELIARELHSLPDWISFVVTSRPEADVVNRLQGFKAFELDTQDARNQADLRAWYRANLGRRSELSALPTEQQHSIENLLIERSAGMILYLKVVEEGFVEGSLTVDTLEQLESGLPGLFRLYHDSFRQRFGSDYELAIKPLLRLLHAAGGPLPKDLACAVLQWNSEQFLACRNRLGSYVQETAAGYELFHKTLGEWLSAEASGPFHLDQVIGRQAIADLLFAELDEKEFSELRWRDLIRKWLPAWLPKLRQFDEAKQLDLLGGALKYCADYKNAKAVLERSLLVKRHILRPGDPDIALSLGQLGDLIQDTGGYDEAEPLLREAKKIMTAAPSASRRNIAVCLNRLANLLRIKGQDYYDEAKSLFEDALKILKEELPPGHKDIAAILNNLSILLLAKGDYEQAERSLREALEIRRSAPLAEDRDIAKSLNNLAKLLLDKADFKRAAADYTEAEELLNEALKKQRTSLRLGHPDISATLINLADLLSDTQRPEEAEPLLREALKIRRDALPPKSPEIADSLNNLGVFLGEKCRGLDESECKEECKKECESLLREALDIMRGAWPAGDLRIANSLENLAGFLFESHRYQEALPLYSEAREICTKALPAGDPDIARSIRNLVRCRERAA